MPLVNTSTLIAWLLAGTDAALMVHDAVGVKVNNPPKVGFSEIDAPGVRAAIASYRLPVVVLPDTVKLVEAVNTVKAPVLAEEAPIGVPLIVPAVMVAVRG